MLPRVALVDPELTLTLPPAVTASTGMDALAQVIEPFVCNRANPMTDAVCREGMARAARSLRRAYERADDLAAREDMSIASLFGGLALANAGLGAVHGFAGVIGGMFHAPHGAVCAALLPPVMAANVRALRERAPVSPVLARYDEVARILTGDADATAADGAAWVEELRQALGIPGLGAYGVAPGDYGAVVEKSAVASSMKPNPIQLTGDELREILERSV
jgi:alcohol dehydrogenase class IV